MANAPDQTKDLADFLARHAKSYDPATDNHEERPPFAADIKAGRN